MDVDDRRSVRMNLPPIYEMADAALPSYHRSTMLRAQGMEQTVRPMAITSNEIAEMTRHSGRGDEQDSYTTSFNTD
jgi:hypothetical protein